MDLYEQLAPEQFRAIFNTPISAAMYVATASGGGFDMAKELADAGKFIDQSARSEGGSAYGELVDSLVAKLRTMSKDDAKAMRPDYAQSKDVAALRGQMKQAVVEGWTVAEGLPGSDGFAKWVIEIGRSAALARTGGHFGIGNKSVIDEQEQAALDELTASMVSSGE